MPIYEYACQSCGHEFEKLQKVSAPAPDCPECGEGVRKKVSKTSFQLKGTGWYVTDYKKTPGSTAPSSTTSIPPASSGEAASSGDSASSAPAAPASTESTTSTPASTPASSGASSAG